MKVDVEGGVTVVHTADVTAEGLWCAIHYPEGKVTGEFMDGRLVRIRYDADNITSALLRRSVIGDLQRACIETWARYAPTVDAPPHTLCNTCGAAVQRMTDPAAPRPAGLDGPVKHLSSWNRPCGHTGSTWEDPDGNQG